MGGGKKAKPDRLADFAAAAAATLPGEVWDYLDGGAGAEWTLRENTAAFARRTLRPRVLTDVSRVSPATTLLGAALPHPVGIAPTAYHRLVHPDGEVATATGAAGALHVVSMFASTPLADIAAAASGPLWMQLYWLRDRAVLLDLVRRAEAAGFDALVLTVDTPTVARRPRDARNGFTVPPGVAAVNVAASVMASSHVAQDGSSAIERHSREQFDQTTTWADLAWLRERSPLPLVLKGILTAEDTRLARAHGVDAVIVSNHGGRQLDGAPATVDALTEVVDAAAGLPVLLDGGVRSGRDALVALALGARAVLLGRPVVWGLAHAGADGVRAVLNLVVDELTEAMTLTGRPTLADLDRSAVSGTR
ncbi:L-lactate dehydrogenase [Actinokineospora spheciospongiae]|uniref:L-lactate dehydrogenase n=1 Tax=Actinokineospora spheciospongiae TaxID=909613 RepID=W7IJ46_9PSEU|nr:alpha-hydroxy acid oxidase [Actinokineospora spheciospongiae]EWC60333.1 L-lactate dehydrogenase [Actinokineospora spheciospongiae]